LHPTVSEEIRSLKVPSDDTSLQRLYELLPDTTMGANRQSRRNERRMGRPPRKEGSGVLINFRATAEERTAFQEAAATAGLSLSDWIRSLCEAEIRRQARRS
jgi:predicted HicB family RNase H-like nuclease